MKRAGTSRRNGVALAGSAAFHILILLAILQQASPIYDLPQPVAPAEPPMDAQIVELEPPPRPVIIPRLTPPQTTPQRTPQITPTPPRPVTPPQPLPRPPIPQPAPPTPAPALPTPLVPPKTAPAMLPITPKAVIQAPQAPRLTPIVPPIVAQRPAPVLTPAPPLPAPPAPAVARAPPAPAATAHLNIHKPEKDAPANIATLPLAPAPGGGQPAAGQRSASGPASGGEPGLGGSRLQGLTPYPYGSMPSGGSGLRGSLIGCANAEAVSLSPVERARCNARFGADAGSAPAIDQMSPAKRAAFDKAAAEDEASRRYRSAMPTGTTPGRPGAYGLGPDQPQSVRDMVSHPQ